MGRLARAIGEPTRIGMLTLLMEGRALTAKELAFGAGVRPSTGTTHLRRLMDDSLVIVARQGRHKYFRLASPDVARCVESLMSVASPVTETKAGPDSPLREARLCYDHLAGRLGMQITEALLARRLLKKSGREFVATRKGERHLAIFGIDLAALRRSRRRFACACLDWSERKDHIDGALGSALAARMLEAGWLRQIPGTRCVTVTKTGRTALAEYFGIDWTG
jgi:DNA-binding transcriptional ArsR family regulator